MSTGPDERAARHRERLLDALRVCGGWMPRTPLRWHAFGGDPIPSAEITKALTALEAEGLIATRQRRRKRGISFDGGDTVTDYRATMTTVPGDESRDHGRMPLDLAPFDRLALLDAAHAQLLAARSDPSIGVATEQQFMRILGALLGSELDPEDSPDADPGAGDCVS